MEDATAVQLLQLLRDYHRDYGTAADLDPRRLTVAQLAGDLLDSLPRTTDLPRGLAILNPDNLATRRLP